MEYDLRTRVEKGLAILLFLVVPASLWFVFFLFTGDSGNKLYTYGIPTVLTIISVGIALLVSMDRILGNPGLREASEENGAESWVMEEARKLAAKAEVSEPTVYIQSGSMPNAATWGFTEHGISVSVTEGALAHFSEREMRGVLAHEIAHIKNRDYMRSAIGVKVLGCLEIVRAKLSGITAWLKGAVLDVPNQKVSKEAKVLAALFWGFLFLSVVGFHILMTMITRIAQISYYASCRRKEYVADRIAAILSRDPLGLASALEKIRNIKHSKRLAIAAVPAGRSLYIHSDHDTSSTLSFISRSHPPIDRRISRLQKMGDTREIPPIEPDS